MSSSLSLQSLFGVEGKKVLITGAGTGIGLMMAQGFAENGATVYIVGRRAEKLEEAARNYAQYSNGKGKLVPLPGDVSSKDAIGKIVQDYSKLEDHLDVLINNAGIIRDPPVTSHPNDLETLAASLWSPPWEDFSETFGVNISSQYFTTVGFVPLLHAAALKTPEGAEKPSVINIGSIVGYTNQRDRWPASYQISKSAIPHLTKVLATRLMPYHIRVNSVAPGLFPSELTSDPSKPFDVKEFEEKFNVANMIPEGRSGRPQDIAGPALFLSSRAGAFINGVNFLDDGGRALIVSGRLEK